MWWCIAYIYSVVHLLPVLSSVIITLISPDVINELYSIVVTCIIHPDNIVDQCVVMAMNDGRVTRTGKYVDMYVHIME